MGQWDGSGFGIRFTGKYLRDLTMNLGVVELRDGAMKLTVDVRYPNDITDRELMERMQKVLDEAGSAWILTEESNSEALFMDPDSAYIQMLAGAYREITGDMDSPLGVTGGTYARLFPNHVTFGPIFPTDGPLPEGVGSLHQANEAIQVKQLVQICAIYAKLLVELMQ